MIFWKVLCLNDYLLLNSPACAACRQDIRPVPDTGVLVRVRMGNKMEWTEKKEYTKILEKIRYIHNIQDG